MNQKQTDRDMRLHVMLGICLLLFVILLGRMVYLQLWRGDYYTKQSDGNRLRQSKIIAPRGLIYDKDGKELVNNLPGYTALLQKQSEYKPETLQSISQLLQLPLEEIHSFSIASSSRLGTSGMFGIAICVSRTSSLPMPNRSI